MPSIETNYPPAAFCFQVTVDSNDTAQTFQEVSGIEGEMESEEIAEGGENRFVHRLPRNLKHPRLELKRGIAPRSSPLVAWCRSVLESDLGIAIEPKVVLLSLLDQDGKPLRRWKFSNAFPVKWEIDAFPAAGNEVAIETISLNYAFSERTL